MTTRRRLGLRLLSLVLVGGATAAWFAWPETLPNLVRAPDDDRPARVTVGKNVLVSSTRATMLHQGTTIAADPSDARRLFAASMHELGETNGQQDAGIIGYYSHDGGATWDFGCERVSEKGGGCCDEGVAFGPAGSLYLTHMRLSAKDRRGLVFGGQADGGIDFLRSGDGGKTWAELPPIRRLIDRPQLAIDCTDGPFRGRLYCNANVGKAAFYTSIDSGKPSQSTTSRPSPGSPQ